jgi:hypothetical protein
VADIPAGLRAELDRELATAVESILTMAAEYDGQDIIEANVELSDDLLELLAPRQLAAAAAMLALRMQRSAVTRG